MSHSHWDQLHGGKAGNLDPGAWSSIEPQTASLSLYATEFTTNCIKAMRKLQEITFSEHAEQLIMMALRESAKLLFDHVLVKNPYWKKISNLIKLLIRPKRLLVFVLCHRLNEHVNGEKEYKRAQTTNKRLTIQREVWWGKYSGRSICSK